jgi:hypothetical protein
MVFGVDVSPNANGTCSVLRTRYSQTIEEKRSPRIFFFYWRYRVDLERVVDTCHSRQIQAIESLGSQPTVYTPP